MIQATELRIGNWIINGLGEPFQVNRDLTLAQAALGQFQPIPLSPEILENCGFVADEFGNFRNGLIRIVQDNEDGAGITIQFRIDINGGLIHIEYLHNLQNIVFELKKQELEVNL